MASARRVRVFVVDDSAVARHALRRLLEQAPGFQVVGEAADGARALSEIARERPDLVLMDVVMPELDGIQATQALMSERACPILIVSDLVGRDADLNFKALEAGALDLVAKPTAAEIADPERARQWLRRLRVLADVPVVTRHRRPEPRPKPLARPPAAPPDGRRVSLVALGSSTGGPPALGTILRAVGTEAPWPIVMVQHIAPGFTDGLARWLATSTGQRVEVVDAPVPPQNGVVYMAPDRHHLVLRGRQLALTEGDLERGHRPSVDVLFHSIAESGMAPECAAVLLTGMGEDGARGLGAIREGGGYTIAQHASDCVVYGMPRAAIERGAACEALPVEQIAPRLLGLGRGHASMPQSANR